MQDSRRAKLLLSHPHLAETFLKTSVWRQLVSSGSKSSLCLTERLQGSALCVASNTTPKWLGEVSSVLNLFPLLVFSVR